MRTTNRRSKYGTYYWTGSPAHRVMDKMWVSGLSKPEEIVAAKASVKKQLERIFERDPQLQERVAVLAANKKTKREASAKRKKSVRAKRKKADRIATVADQAKR